MTRSLGAKDEDLGSDDPGTAEYADDLALPVDFPHGFSYAPPGSKRCNCKKARCLKLYCVCFSAGVYCSNCACRECLNTLEHRDLVAAERSKKLAASPGAFAPKVEQKAEGELACHKKGCRCRRSRCIKKYCECFDARVFCSSSCRCEACLNQPSGGPPAPTAMPHVQLVLNRGSSSEMLLPMASAAAGNHPTAAAVAAAAVAAAASALNESAFSAQAMDFDLDLCALDPARAALLASAHGSQDVGGRGGGSGDGAASEAGLGPLGSQLLTHGSFTAPLIGSAKGLLPPFPLLPLSFSTSSQLTLTNSQDAAAAAVTAEAAAAARAGACGVAGSGHQLRPLEAAAAVTGQGLRLGAAVESCGGDLADRRGSGGPADGSQGGHGGIAAAEMPGGAARGPQPPSAFMSALAQASAVADLCAATQPPAATAATPPVVLAARTSAADADAGTKGHGTCAGGDGARIKAQLSDGAAGGAAAPGTVTAGSKQQCADEGAEAVAHPDAPATGGLPDGVNGARCNGGSDGGGREAGSAEDATTARNKRRNSSDPEDAVAGPARATNPAGPCPPAPQPLPPMPSGGSGGAPSCDVPTGEPGRQVGNSVMAAAEAAAAAAAGGADACGAPAALQPLALGVQVPYGCAGGLTGDDGVGGGTSGLEALLAAPGLLLEDPERAGELAAQLGLDAPQQLAARKAAHILRTLLHMADGAVRLTRCGALPTLSSLRRSSQPAGSGVGLGLGLALPAAHLGTQLPLDSLHSRAVQAGMTVSAADAGGGTSQDGGPGRAGGTAAARGGAGNLAQVVLQPQDALTNPASTQLPPQQQLEGQGQAPQGQEQGQQQQPGLQFQGGPAFLAARAHRGPSMQEAATAPPSNIAGRILHLPPLKLPPLKLSNHLQAVGSGTAGGGAAAGANPGISAGGGSGGGALRLGYGSYRFTASGRLTGPEPSVVSGASQQGDGLDGRITIASAVSPGPRRRLRDAGARLGAAEPEASYSQPPTRSAAHAGGSVGAAISVGGGAGGSVGGGGGEPVGPRRGSRLKRPNSLLADMELDPEKDPKEDRSGLSHHHHHYHHHHRSPGPGHSYRSRQHHNDQHGYQGGTPAFEAPSPKRSRQAAGASGRSRGRASSWHVHDHGGGGYGGAIGGGGGGDYWSEDGGAERYERRRQQEQDLEGGGDVGGSDDVDHRPADHLRGPTGPRRRRSARRILGTATGDEGRIGEEAEVEAGSSGDGDGEDRGGEEGPAAVGAGGWGPSGSGSADESADVASEMEAMQALFDLRAAATNVC